MDTTSSPRERFAVPRPVMVLVLVALLSLTVFAGALLTGGFRPTSPTLGPITNGRIFVADGTQLLSFAADGKDRQPVRALDARASDLRFSPDGKRLAYALDVPGGRIEIIDVASGNTTQIVVRGMTAIGGPIGWSPDGGRILFAATDGSTESIHVAATDGSGSRTVTTSAIMPGGRWTAGWSPRGDQIAFVAADPNSGVGTIWVGRPDGSEMRAVPGGPVAAESVSWSPDPTVERLLFTADGNHVRFIDLGAATTTEVNDQFWPTWSPSGDRIVAWQADLYRTADLLAGDRRSLPLTAKWAAGNCAQHPEFKGRGFCGPLSWSPDGTRVYAPDITGDSILSVRADGKGDPIVIPLTTNVTDTDGAVAWQPLVP